MKAFPSISNKRMQDLDGFWFTPSSEGMDLRDYFAAKVMQSIFPVVVENRITVEWVAKESYLMADAMMEARK